MDHAIFEAICEDIASCGDDNRTVCERHGTSDRTFYRFVAADEEACQKYARAKQLQADVRAEGFGEEVTRSLADDAPKLRVKLDYLKWSNAHLAARKWGDKVDVTSGGDKVQSTPLMVVCSNQETAGILERMARGEQPATSTSKDS